MPVHHEFAIVTVALALGLFAAVLALLEIGRRLGARRIAQYGKEGLTGLGYVDAPVFGLFALLMGFAFSGSASRFDHRRDLIARQVNAISTGWDRIDALPPPSQAAVRASFRAYVDALIVVYASEHGVRGVLEEAPPVMRARETLWMDAVAACLAPDGEKARMLMLPALNEIFDAADNERLARWIHPPVLIYAMLGITAFAAALFAGFGLASAPSRNWMYMIGIAATFAIALFVTIELEYPRRGLIRIEAMDQALTQLRMNMK